MANTISSNLNNNIISSSALEQFTSILAPLGAFSTSFNDEAAQKGTTISITKISNTSSADDFAASTGYLSMDTALGAVQITINRHKIVTWHVTDTEVSESSAVELQRFGYQKGGDLAKAVFQDVLSQVTNSVFSSKITVVVGDFDGDEVADLREDGVDQSLYPDQCSLILANDYFTLLLKDSDLSHALNYGSAEVIQGGRVPSLFGIKSIYESNSVPANSENLKGFYCHPSAMAVGMRYLQPTNTKEYIAARKLTDPNTGITMGYREFYDPKLGVQTAALECVYGFTVGISENLIRVVAS